MEPLRAQNPGAKTYYDNSDNGLGKRALLQRCKHLAHGCGIVSHAQCVATVYLHRDARGCEMFVWSIGAGDTYVRISANQMELPISCPTASD